MFSCLLMEVMMDEEHIKTNWKSLDIFIVLVSFGLQFLPFVFQSKNVILEKKKSSSGRVDSWKIIGFYLTLKNRSFIGCHRIKLINPLPYIDGLVQNNC